MSDVTITGNIGEPNLKFTPQGKAVLEFSLAENHSKKDGTEWVDDGTTWRRVSIWEKKAEALAEQLKKGDRVIVVGQERLREFETQEGKGKSLEVKARDVGVIPKISGGNSGGDWGGSNNAGGGQGWGGGADQSEAPF